MCVDYPGLLKVTQPTLFCLADLHNAFEAEVFWRRVARVETCVRNLSDGWKAQATLAWKQMRNAADARDFDRTRWRHVVNDRARPYHPRQDLPASQGFRFKQIANRVAAGSPEMKEGSERQLEPFVRFASFISSAAIDQPV